MKTFNEIKKSILDINSTVQATSKRRYEIMRSDGLRETHFEYKFGEPVISIRKDIWNSNLALSEKLELNELLVSKLAN